MKEGKKEEEEEEDEEKEISSENWIYIRALLI